MTRDPNLEDHEAWLQTVLPRHERLATAVHSLIENMLQKEKVEFLNVTNRVKELAEAVEKIKRKSYSDPKNQLTDLSGIRIVTFLESQVNKINKIIRDLFEIDEPNSLDRSMALGLDRIGYRSTHFVCTLGRAREKLPEYEGLGGLKFEIQVRTVLQHAWAELAHDRSFKFSVALPQKIERKLNLYSGLLEITDGAFDDISKEIDQYKEAIDEKDLKQISSAEIDSISVEKFLKNILKAHKIKAATLSPSSDLVEEIKHSGFNTIGEIEKVATNKYIIAYKKNFSQSGTGIAFLRTLLIYHDPSKYFDRKPQWATIPESAFKTIIAGQPEGEVRKYLDKYSIRISNVRALRKARRKQRA